MPVADIIDQYYRAGPEPGSFIASNPQFFLQQPNAIEISDLRMQFKIEMSLESSPNAAEITITPSTMKKKSSGR